MVQLIFLVYLQIVIVFTKIQQLYLAENEQFQQSRQALIIATNDTEIVENEFSDIDTLLRNAKTLSKQLSSQYNIYTMESDFINVFTSLQYDNSAIDICFSKLGYINCKYRIMNQLVDEDLIIFESYQYTLQIENKICEQLYNIQINKFIVLCKSQQGLTINLINNQSEIIDSLLIESLYNQTQHQIFKDKNLIIYETLDTLCALFVVGWTNDQSYLQMKQLIVNGQDYIDSEIVGQINNVQFYQSNILIIYFSYLILHINLLNFSITTQFILNNHEIEYFQFIQLPQLNSQMIIYLDNRIQKTFEIGNKEFRINSQFQKIKQVQFIKQNIIIEFQSLLYIVNNQFIYDVLKTELSQVVYLENLPFILLFQKQGQLSFFKINSFPSYLQYQKSTYLSVFWCVDMIIHEQATIYRINQLPKNFTILLENNSFQLRIEDSNRTQVTYYYKNKIIGYPSQITHFDDMNGVVSQIQNSDLIISNITRNTIILTKKYVESQIKIIFHVNQTLTIQDEINKIYLKYQYRFNFNESQFFIGSQDYSFIVQDKQTLYFYSYVKTELKAFKINFEKKINYLVQQGNQLFIYFQNCMIMIVEFQNFQINEVNHSHQVNCTIYLNDDSDILNIKIQPSQIDILRKSTYTQSLRFHQIIRLQYFINYKRLIIFELNENLLQMKYYQEKNNQYQFLYLIPTYQYIIDQPLIYKTFVQMIAILAHNEQNDQYILIYDLHNKALNSMVSAIQVDEKCQIFNFHSSSQFFYVYNNELRIQFLDFIKILFKNDIFKSNMNSYFYITDIMLKFDPKYVINNNSIILNLTFINSNQSLQLLTNKQLSYFIQNQKKIIPLNEVFGRINSITQYNGDKLTNLSSLTLMDQQECSFFKQKTCLIENNKIIIDSFDLRLTLQLNQTPIINELALFISKYNIFIYTIDDLKILKIHNYNLEGKLIEQNSIKALIEMDKIFLNSIQVIENFILFDNKKDRQTKMLFLIQNYQIQQFLINGQNEFQFIFIRKTPNFYFITYQTYTMIQNSETIILLFLSFQFDIITQTNISLSKIISRDSTNELLKISVSEFVFDNDNYKFELLICSVTLNCYYLQLQFDFKFNYFDQKILNILRYEINKSLKKIEFVSSKYVILGFYNDGNIKYIYNINQSNKFILDSHQQIELADYKIEKYNDTYFTVIKCNPNCDVKLFQLHNYYISCQYACDDQQIYLLLQNQVNQLNLTFVNFISKDNKLNSRQIKSQQLIIIITGVLLYLYLCKAQKKSKKQ